LGIRIIDLADEGICDYREDSMAWLDGWNRP
jgi:hypothetical protein